MKIKLLTSIAGSRFSYNCGAEVDWHDDAEANRLIANGLAVAVPVAEVATLSPEETPEGGDGGGEVADAPAAKETAAAKPRSAKGTDALAGKGGAGKSKQR